MVFWKKPIHILHLFGNTVFKRGGQMQEETYVPRPLWQVWGARIALVVFILGLIMYYCNIFGAVR